MSPRTLALTAVLAGAGLALVAGSMADGGANQALAVGAAAGGLLLVMLGPRGRRVLSVLLALDAAGMIITGVLQIRSAGVTGTVVLVVAGFLVGGGAILTMITSPHWPTRSARYRRDRPDGDEAAWWQALDAGIDPTAEPGPGDPDVHDRSSPDTMGDAHQSQQSSRRE